MRKMILLMIVCLICVMGLSCIDYETMYKQKLNDISSLTNQINSLNSQIATMQQTLNSLNQQNINLKQQNDNLQTQLTEAQNHLTTAQNKEYQSVYPSVFSYPYNDYNYYQWNYPYDYNHSHYNYWWLRQNPPSNGTSYGPWKSWQDY